MDWLSETNIMLIDHDHYHYMDHYRHHNDHHNHSTCSLAGTEVWIGRVAKELQNVLRPPLPDHDSDNDEEMVE